MRKHTPGPWNFDIHTANEYGNVACCKLAIFSTKGAEYQVATIISDADLPDEANASLIAAAPDLLDALEAAYSILARVDHQWEDRHQAKGQWTLCKMRDAIAKATDKTDQETQDLYAVAKAEGAK